MPTQNPSSKRRLDGETPPSTKRSRVSRACDQCRTAREKCDGQPTCSTCSTSKRACTYTANPKKRGIQPGYIRTLELALTWLFHHSDAENILLRKLGNEGAASVLLGKDSTTKESNKLHRSWRRSKFFKDVDKLLSGESIDDENRVTLSDDELESDLEEPDLQITSTFDSAIKAPQYTAAVSSDHVIGPARSIEATILPVDRWRLLDVYFAHTHCWFPICEKHDVLKLSYTYPESGIQLTNDMTASAAHAELWSIFSLASLQVNEDSSGSFEMFEIARSLIPNELADFEIGHVKALLILALVVLSHSGPISAWLLIGFATRVMLAIESRNPLQMAQYKGVFSGCFILDNIISNQIQRRPYLAISDIERIGKIYEDGLEEWQPWTSCLDTNTTRSQSRAPVLSLSTFNGLVEIIGIIGLSKSDETTGTTLQEAIRRLEIWKLALPPPFDHIRTERTYPPATPPALLLHLAYHCCCLVLYSSQSWALRALESLERFRDTLGSVAAPAIIRSLVELVRKSSAFHAVDERCQARFQRVVADFDKAWMRNFPGNGSTSKNMLKDSPVVRGRPMPEPTSAHSRRSFGSAMQMPTPESIHVPFNPTSFASNRPTRTEPSLLEDLLPDMNATALSHRAQSVDFQNASMEGTFKAPILDQANAVASRDLESFFDELASLDGAEALEGRPRFMQNLGFAPDANMADFLTADYGSFNPLISPYLQQGVHDPSQLDQTNYFNGG